MTQKLYVRLIKSECVLNPETGVWKYKFPDQFVNSRSPNKKITVLNFLYYGRYFPRNDTDKIQYDHITFHSPTLCDGNYHQDHYIGVFYYNYNTCYKTYDIHSNPQYLEFYFKHPNDDKRTNDDPDYEVIKQFDFEPGESGADKRRFEERFSVDLCLEY